ncbi:MAG: bL21 family ribosomal protein [Patescibacteria group bacterium]
MSFVVESGNNQFLVNHSQKIIVDRLEAKEGDLIKLPVIFDKEGKLTQVEAKVIEHIKGDKIRVVKYRAKSNYHKVYGHRSFQTVLEVM